MNRKSLLSLLFLALPSVAAAAAEIHVAPSGDDANPGTAALPKRTLDAALVAARKLQDSVTVVVAGTHYLSHTVALDGRDSGTAIRGEEGARLMLASPLPPLSPVTDPAVTSRLPPSALPRVLRVDLKPLGLPSYGTLAPRGFGRSYPGALELFCNDQPLTVARYPNAGTWAHIAADNGDTKDSFSYAPPADHPIRWQGRDDVWMHGYWTWDWAESYEHLVSYDPVARRIHTSPPHGVYGYRANQRFYFLNVLEELDAPGEYYLDRHSGILYVYPPSSTPQSAIRNPQYWVSNSAGPIVSVTNAHDVRIESLTLEGSWTTAAEVKDCTNVVLSRCTIRNTATDGVTIAGGSACGLSHCTIYNTGESPVRLAGGDRKSLTPARHFVEDTDIHDYARTCRTYRPAVEMTGVGCRVSHCAIHDAPHMGVLLHGNDHVIEDSALYNLCQETGDAGAIYIGRDWTERGTVIRHNLFHHIQGPGKIGTFAVYFDDGASAGTITDNIFYRCYRAITLGGSTDMRVEHNLFSECDGALHLDGRGDMLDDPTWRDNYNTLVQRLKSVDYANPPWSARYPTLLDVAALATQGKGVPPARDTFRHNLQSGGKWIGTQYGIKDPSILHFDHNFLDTPAKYLRDPDHLDFGLTADAPMKDGFADIPQSDIGPRSN